MGDKVAAGAGKAVPSSAGGGPRDFSAAVHANFTQPPGPEPDGSGCLTARIYLGEREQGKISAEDLFEAVAELLSRHGVDMERCFLESWRRQENGIPVAICAGRMP
jgi:hypothetical protein